MLPLYILLEETKGIISLNTMLHQMLEGNETFFDSVIVYIDFLTQQDVFHHDHATKFLFLQGFSDSMSLQPMAAQVLGFYLILSSGAFKCA